MDVNKYEVVIINEDWRMLIENNEEKIIHPKLGIDELDAKAWHIIKNGIDKWFNGTNGVNDVFSTELKKAYLRGIERALEIVKKEMDTFNFLIKGSDIEEYVIPDEMKDYYDIEKEEKPENICCENMDKKHIYLLKYSDTYKIGLSHNAKARFKEIEKQYKRAEPNMPYEIKLVKYWEVKDAYKMEEELHIYFENKRLNGEWFKLKKGDLKIIDNLIEDSEHGRIYHEET